MDSRKLLTITLVYGAADVIVMAVGGFLLLPLYTRTLTQAEFGTYVLVRTNTELLTFLIQLGLPSAVSRVYFDFKAAGRQLAYLNSVLMLFLLCFAGVLILLWFWGEALWSVLSPATPAQPYLQFSVAIAAATFVSTLGTLWLRMEQRALAFAFVQVSTAGLLLGLALINLVVLDLGLTGLLWALLLSFSGSVLVIPWLLRKEWRPKIDWAHVAASYPFAIPALLGYVAFFLLNRVSTLVLQRYVPVDELAVFGVAQQLALVLTITAGAFGKAQQPVVFGEAPEQAHAVLERAGKVLRLMMFCVCAVLVLFASELFALAAPSTYEGGTDILLILLIANFAISFNQVSDTALLYHRKPKASLYVVLAGAGLSTVMSMLLIPHYFALGAAAAIATTSLFMALYSHWLARRVTGQSYLFPMVRAMVAITVLALGVRFLPDLGWSAFAQLGFKLVLAAGLGSVAFTTFRRQS